MAVLALVVLAHWIVVQYVVEAKVSEPLRDRIAGKHKVCFEDWGQQDSPERPCQRHERGYTIERRPKLAYLVTCRMCSGFWVAVAFGLALHLSPLSTLAVAALSHWLFIAQRIAEKAAK